MLELIKNSPSEIQRRIKVDYDSYSDGIAMLTNLYRMASKCESPIEALLFWSFISQWNGEPEGIDDLWSNILFVTVNTSGPVDIMGLQLQYDIEVDNHNYRADFLIQCCSTTVPPHPDSINYVVEVDGHDFHEKTKAQAQKDKFRDRMLQKAGYKVLRFTGSEVYKDPDAIVREIAEVIAG